MLRHRGDRDARSRGSSFRSSTSAQVPRRRRTSWWTTRSSSSGCLSILRLTTGRNQTFARRASGRRSKDCSRTYRAAARRLTPLGCSWGSYTHPPWSVVRFCMKHATEQARTWRVTWPVRRSSHSSTVDSRQHLFTSCPQWLPLGEHGGRRRRRHSSAVPLPANTGLSPKTIRTSRVFQARPGQGRRWSASTSQHSGRTGSPGMRTPRCRGMRLNRM